MPTNKKKKGQKKKKKDAVGPPSSLTTIVDEAALTWAETKRDITSKSLAKHLPHIAEKLRNGEIEPDALAEKLSKCHELRDKTDQDSAEFLYLSACKNFDENDVDRRKFYYELVIAILECRREETGDLYAPVKKAFDKVGSIWSRRIYKKTKKTLRETSEFFLLDNLQNFEETFESAFNAWRGCDIVDLYEKLVEEQELHNEKYDSIKVAAEGIVLGEDIIKNICWECSKQESEGEELKICSLCKCARYCSEACQLAAWKSGHKTACKGLSETYANYKKDRQRIKQAVKDKLIYTSPLTIKDDETGEIIAKDMMCRLKPIPSHEYNLLRSIMERYHALVHIPTPEGIRGPSMDIFYKNVAILACGGSHPLFKGKPSFRPVTKILEGLKKFDMNEYMKKKVTTEEERERSRPRVEERESFDRITLFLSMDFTGASDPYEVDDYITLMTSRNKNVLCATRFVEIYIMQNLDEKKLAKYTSDARVGSEIKVFQMLKDYRHKMTITEHCRKVIGDQRAKKGQHN